MGLVLCRGRCGDLLEATDLGEGVAGNMISELATLRSVTAENYSKRLRSP